MRASHWNLLVILTAMVLPLAGSAQVNSGSDGHDGALNPTSNLVIDMADHPDGIYHYTSVNIPAGVTVSFVPNAGNKPVVWLVQGNCIVGGWIQVRPGGYAGGNSGTYPSAGLGPGGGSVPRGSGSFGGKGQVQSGQGSSGVTYGNQYLLPLLGGSGGAGSSSSGFVGGSGGGALLIASGGYTKIDGFISATGGDSGGFDSSGFVTGGGSGGGVRIVASKISGSGRGETYGGNNSTAGTGRIRFDSFQNDFNGEIVGAVFSSGFQPIIIPAPAQGIQLAIQNLAGVAVPASPSGVSANPDVIIPAQQANPIPIVVRCTNIPLNTEISVVVHPANGPDVQAVGLNNAGNAASSTATVSLNMPRGGGIIYAKAVTGIAGTASTASPADTKTPSLAETGWTADGERFVKMEITAALGGAQQVAYITESGKRYSLAGR